MPKSKPHRQKELKIKVRAEGRKDIWIPIDKKNLKQWIVMKKFNSIHNFVPSGTILIGANHDVKSVLEDIDRADRLAIFIDPTANMGHSLALIWNEKLECYDIGKLTEKNLSVT